jgi:hypothetical protein
MWQFIRAWAKDWASLVTGGLALIPAFLSQYLDGYAEVINNTFLVVAFFIVSYRLWSLEYKTRLDLEALISPQFTLTLIGFMQGCLTTGSGIKHVFTATIYNASKTHTIRNCHFELDQLNVCACFDLPPGKQATRAILWAETDWSRFETRSYPTGKQPHIELFIPQERILRITAYGDDTPCVRSQARLHPTTDAWEIELLDAV